MERQTESFYRERVFYREREFWQRCNIQSYLRYFFVNLFYLCTRLRLQNISIHYGNYGYYHSIRSKYFFFKIKHCKLAANIMLNAHMSCLENSVNPNHATSYLFDDTS